MNKSECHGTTSNPRLDIRSLKKEELEFEDNLSYEKMQIFERLSWVLKKGDLHNLPWGLVRSKDNCSSAGNSKSIQFHLDSTWTYSLIDKDIDFISYYMYVMCVLLTQLSSSN